MNKNEILEKANRYAEYLRNYGYIAMVFEFDHTTIAPKKGLEEGNNAMAMLGNDIYKTMKSDDYISFVKEAYEKRKEFDPLHQRVFELAYRSLIKNEKISPEFQYKMSLAENKAYTTWLKAKEASDYSIFEPALKAVVELKREECKLRNPSAIHPYDVLLDDFEPNENEEGLDLFFNELKKGIIPLLSKIVNAKKIIRKDFLSYNVNVRKQEKMARWLLKYNGFDMASGVFSTTEHPFTTFPSHHDVRVTTHYYPTMFTSNIYSIIHEGGHGIFAQNEPSKYYEIGLSGSMTSAQHETISRFYENLVGKNEFYVKNIWHKISKLCQNEFSNVSEDEFYKGVNIVEPSFIRTEADELTYCLHIIIRYEIEKGLIDGRIDTKDLNKVWNEKYHEYLGLDVLNDKEGILQDVHWSNGSFGYFPSYALGNAYGAQILHTMKRDMDFDKTLSEGNLKQIKAYLIKKVFHDASLLDPEDWIKEISGETLNPKYYLDYLQDKFTKLYNL